MASSCRSDDHRESGDDVVTGHGHREQEDRAQETSEVVNRVLKILNVFDSNFFF